jgi:hypothetical protein
MALVLALEVRAKSHYRMRCLTRAAQGSQPPPQPPQQPLRLRLQQQEAQEQGREQPQAQGQGLPQGQEGELHLAQGGLLSYWVWASAVVVALASLWCVVCWATEPGAAA